MSGFIGVCLEDGAFLSADTRRIDIKTGEIYAEVIQKIHRLNLNTMIATGGLGTIGHEARQALTDSIKNRNLNIDEIITLAKPIFKEAYKKSLIELPNHKIPLYAIFAGCDIRSHKGFIKVIRSSDMFNAEFSLDKPGQPYFTGSNTRVVQEIASDCYYYMKKNYNNLNLDLWSLLSFNEIVKIQNEIGFPIQLTLVKENSYIQKFPIYKSENYIHDKNFETEFYY